MKVKNICIIDDDHEVMDVITSCFIDDNYHVIKYYDSDTFIENISNIDSRVFIVDWVLTGKINGIQVIKEIRKKYADALIILISGNSSKEEIICGLNSGADDYLTKPFNISLLLAKVNYWLSHSESDLELNKNLKIADIKNNENPDHVSNTGTKLEITLKFLEESEVILFNDSSVKLSHCEFQIIKILYESQKRPVNRNILVSSISKDHYITERNIDVHIFNIRKKINSLGLHIKSVRGLGYLLTSK